jgi:hypothetical protein
VRLCDGACCLHRPLGSSASDAAMLEASGLTSCISSEGQ